MALTPFAIGRFGGLNVDDSSLTVGAGAAISAANIDFDRAGSVRMRCGYETIKSLTLTTADGFATFETTSGTQQFVAGYTNSGTKKYEAYASTGGAAVASATPTSSTAVISSARIGTPSNEYLYIANGTDTIWRWTGAAFSQPAGMPTATYLTAVPLSNRLAAANITGTSVSRVQFSDAGAPETWTSTSFVDLMPGDGSAITGLATWQNLVFAFKRRRLFVFYGESLGGTGQPIFNYRAIDGYGASVPPVAGDEGVYFFDGRAVWLTAGGVPQRISHGIERFISGDAGVDIFVLGAGAADQTKLSSARLSYSRGRLHLSIYATGGSVYTFVYDPRIESWTCYTTQLRYAADLPKSTSQQESTYWFGTDGKVNRFDLTSSADAGSAISWGHASGYFDMGFPGQAKVISAIRAWGIGTATIAVSADGVIDAPTATVIAGFGILAPPRSAWQMVDREATVLGYTLSGSSSDPVEVHRLVFYPSSVKSPGIE